MTSSNAATSAKSEEIVINRIFDAPRERLWRAWTDPEQVKQWFGPTGFTLPVCKIDLRVGGKTLYCMRSPEGKNFWSTGTYLEIDEPKRIVTTDSFADENGNVVPASTYGMAGNWPLEARITVTFDEDQNRTQFTLQHVGIPAEMREMCTSGWNESFDKLDGYLKK